jgi:hypothetical protein
MPARAAVYALHFEGWLAFGDVALQITGGDRWSADFVVDSSTLMPGGQPSLASTYPTQGTISIGVLTIAVNGSNFSAGSQAAAYGLSCCLNGNSMNSFFLDAFGGTQKLAEERYVNRVQLSLIAPLGTLYHGNTLAEFWQSWDPSQVNGQLTAYVMAGPDTDSPLTSVISGPIDHISITQVPVPAAGILFSAALLSLIRRKMRIDHS